MSHQSDLIGQDILAYLAQHERKELLRFLTCGNVDDGKSTLIGRLLHDSKMIYEDHLEAITKDSKKVGTTGDDIDLALLVDGLQAEREQGITIDVAYRYFSTAKRKFIIADTPGHEQYTRNMATGASTCDLAIILIDARYGVQTQTKRHSFIASLLGIKHIVVAVNKMDLKGFDQGVFEQIKADYLAFAEKINLRPTTLEFVPMSALKGDNVVNKSERSPWYTGQSLMEILETVEVAGDRNFDDLRFPVQYVNRPNLNFRGFAGTLASVDRAFQQQLTALLRFAQGHFGGTASATFLEVGQLALGHQHQAFVLALWQGVLRAEQQGFGDDLGIVFLDQLDDRNVLGLTADGTDRLARIEMLAARCTDQQVPGLLQCLCQVIAGGQAMHASGMPGITEQTD